MALAPGMTISSGRVSITAGIGQVPDSINQGVGFMNNGSVAIDTNAVTGANVTNGFAQNAAGSFFGTTVLTGTDVYEGGVRRSVTGALVYVVGAGNAVNSGNPIDANGALACI